MRKFLNNKRLDDLLDLEYLKSHYTESCIVIEYPIGAKVPESFAVDKNIYIQSVKLFNSKRLQISLGSDILHIAQGMTLTYNLSKSQYVKFKIFFI